MKCILIPFTVLCGINLAIADTVHVTVGDMGCLGRQIGVTESWEKIPGVTLISILPRHPKDPAAQRVFVITTKGASPTKEHLCEALGRRAKHYPIINYKPLKDSQTNQLNPA